MPSDPRSTMVIAWMHLANQSGPKQLLAAAIQVLNKLDEATKMDKPDVDQIKNLHEVMRLLIGTARGKIINEN